MEIMARPKGSKNKSGATPAVKPVVKSPVKYDPRIEEIYETEMEFTCPVRGKVKQKVFVKRIRTLFIEQQTYIPSKNSVDDIENEDSVTNIPNTDSATEE